jgi:intracellular sulfur oxidation DsrE/DsrF family protein
MLVSGMAMASSDAAVARILAQTAPPEGVVFEIVSGDPQQLRKAIPQVQNYIERLRTRFPKLQVAVVSHGEEQFALTRKNEKQYAEVHRAVKSLQASDVPVHVCAAYAAMNNVAPEDFPDYVDVAATGPSEIRTYREFGYVLVQVTVPAQ